MAALAGLLASDDAEMAKAASGTLAAMKGDDVNPAIGAAFAGAAKRHPRAAAGPSGGAQSRRGRPAGRAESRRCPMPVRIAALRTLAPLGTQEQVPALLEVLAKAKDDSERSAVEKALDGIASRAGEGVLPALLAAMNGGAVESRVVLLRVVARVGGAGALRPYGRL